jgi:hypothetical protein
MTEWWVNGPLGLEQGFTVARAPQGDGPLTLLLTLSGELSPRVEPDGKGIRLHRVDGAWVEVVNLATSDGVASDGFGHSVAGSSAADSGKLRRWLLPRIPFHYIQACWLTP